MKSKQASDGAIGRSYAAAICTMALAEAAGMEDVASTRAAAQKAVNYCTEIHQDGEGHNKFGWRYMPKTDGDTSVTGWFIMALKSAKMAGLTVNPESFAGGTRFLNSVEQRTRAKGPRYAIRSRYGYMATGSTQGTPLLTAIGCLCRQYLGANKEDLQASIEGFVEEAGTPGDKYNAGYYDLYYWYYGTLCTFQQGGELWTRWNDGMKKILVEDQCKTGNERGSWNPEGGYSYQWGRAGQTALSALCLEVYYRYPKNSD